MSSVLVNGREIDNTCPYEGECFGQGGCLGECPPTYYDALRAAAVAEHELDFLPHTDPDLAAACPNPSCSRKDS